MKDVQQIRTASQQLISPLFDDPKQLVGWMGAIQAQDYNMSKWAVGIRLQSATIQKIEDALRRGEILRTHVMRPTWHLVAAADIRWMLKLSAPRLKSAMSAGNRQLEITESLYAKTNNLLEKILSGNNHLTRQEIGVEFCKADIAIDTSRMVYFMMRAEFEGIVCSGIDKDNKQTYALIDERIAQTENLYKDEALSRLATNYFRSHSPASLQDFVWWSGLSVTDAKQAINSIDSDLINDRFLSHNLFIHRSCNHELVVDDALHLLPAFDEYIISYKDRTTVLDLDHHPKAFNKNGTFYPIIMYRGKVVGNWKRVAKKGKMDIETSFFEPIVINPDMLQAATDRYKMFC